MRGASSTEICSTILLICVGVIVIGIVTKTESKTPYHTNIHVTDALLREFTFVTTKNTNTLHYNLVLHVTLRNPNKDFGILQDNIAVMAYYQDKKFVAENYSHIFYQEKDGTTLLKLSFKGQQDMDSTLGVQKHLNSEAKQHQCARVEDNNVGSANNSYDIVVRLFLQNTAIPKEAFKKYWNVNSQFICDLKKVPVLNSTNYFKTTECDSYFLQVYCPPGIHIKRLFGNKHSFS